MPAVGGAVVGPIIYFWAREAKGHGVPEVMEAVALKGGLIRPRVSAAKILASAISIGSGGSVGREGPIVQIGSAVGFHRGTDTQGFPGSLANPGRLRRGGRHRRYLQRAHRWRVVQRGNPHGRIRGFNIQPHRVVQRHGHHHFAATILVISRPLSCPGTKSFPCGNFCCTAVWALSSRWWRCCS
jgi:hypothetical protein